MKKKGFMTPERKKKLRVCFHNFINLSFDYKIWAEYLSKDKFRNLKGFFASFFQQMITKQARQRIEEETKERIEVRRTAINEKCGQPKDLNDLSDGKITIF